MTSAGGQGETRTKYNMSLGSPVTADSSSQKILSQHCVSDTTKLNALVRKRQDGPGLPSQLNCSQPALHQHLHQSLVHPFTAPLLDDPICTSFYNCLTSSLHSYITTVYYCRPTSVWQFFTLSISLSLSLVRSVSLSESACHSLPLSPLCPSFL